MIPIQITWINTPSPNSATNQTKLAWKAIRLLRSAKEGTRYRNISYRIARNFGSENRCREEKKRRLTAKLQL